LLDSGFIEGHEVDSVVMEMGVETPVFAGTIKTSPDIIAITQRGLSFLEDLGIKEL
jgi:hypothetical protein